MGKLYVRFFRVLWRKLYKLQGLPLKIIYKQMTTSRSFELSRSFYISIPCFERVLQEIFIEGKQYISLIFAWAFVGFRLFTRVEQTMPSKFKNSNAKFRLKITIFSTYISSCDRNLFPYLVSVFQNVQNGLKIVSPHEQTVCTVCHLEWTCARSESRDESVQHRRPRHCLTLWSFPSFITIPL